MGIVDRIFDGTATMEDVLRHNCCIVTQKIEFEQNNSHAQGDCEKPYCHHGNLRYIQQLKDHLEFLKSQLQDNPNNE